MPGPQHFSKSSPRTPKRASPKGSKPRALPGGVEIIHEDDDLIVINKPAGVLTAGLPGESVESVFNYLKAYIKDQHRRRGTRVWIVHRLDKEASGLLVFAKSDRAFEFLKEEFRAKRPHRLYAAVVEGDIPRTPGSKQPPSGTVQSYLLEDSTGIVRSFAGAPEAAAAQRSPGFKQSDAEGRGDHAKLAVTHWRLMEAALGRSLIQVRLETGRKNQIRVHMKQSKHPIVGDRRYGATTDPIGRVCLHAAELGFIHPATGQTMRFRSATPGPFFSLVGKAKGEGTPFSDQDGGDATDPGRGDRSREAEDKTNPPPRPLPQGGGAEANPPPSPLAKGRGGKSNPSPGPVAQEEAGIQSPLSERGGAQGSWNHVADWYTGLVEDRLSDHHELVILPGAVRLLDVQPGQRVLDVACGQGVLGHRLATLGASVVGVDGSPRLVEAAGRQAGANERYIVGDARALEGLDLGGPCDNAACIMALMNIDPLEPVLRGIAACLKPRGHFVAVLLHPAFRSPGQTGWGWDGPAARGPTPKKKPAASEKPGLQYRRVEGYLSPGVSPIVMNPGHAARGAKPITTTTFHRPIQAYVKAFASAGMLVDALEEWPSVRESAPGPRAAAENRARREIPMFLALRGIKVT